MHGPRLLIFLALALGGFVAFDLLRTIKTGRAHSRYGTITRKQERRFRRYLYGDWLVLAFCIGVIMWLLISSEVGMTLGAPLGT